MRILVTGGGGFLGTHLITELLKNPKYMVTSFSRHAYPHLEEIGVPTIKGDLRNKDDVDRAVSQGFDTIFHVAALAGVWGDYEDYFSINVTGTKNLIESAQKYGVLRFVHTSSPSAVLGLGGHMGTDETMPYPSVHLNAYGETKQKSEEIVLAANDGKTFLTCALRPHLIWGPGDPHIFPRIIQKARDGKLKIVGEGENLVDISYVENVAKAHVQAMEHLVPGGRMAGEAYFLGDERPVKIWEFINTILGLSKIDPPVKHVSYEMAFNAGRVFEFLWKILGIKKPDPPMTRFVAMNLGTDHYFSHAKAKRDFGYHPEVSIEEGLRRTFAHKETLKSFGGQNPSRLPGQNN
jgi:nucleoside-diphosphate-sugar epimerase